VYVAKEIHNKLSEVFIEQPPPFCGVVAVEETYGRAAECDRNIPTHALHGMARLDSENETNDTLND